MIEALIGATTLIIALAGYIVRVERKLTKLQTDVCWIKKQIAPTQQ